MRHKTEHHLAFLQERNTSLAVPGFAGSPTPSLAMRNGQTPGPSGLQNMTLGDEDADGESEEETSRSRRGTSVGSVRKPVGVSLDIAEQIYRDDRPNLVPQLDTFPALLRTAQPTAGPSDKAAWYPAETEEAKADVAFWASMMRDEAYITSLPACPTMAEPPAKRQKRRKGNALASTIYETVGSLNEARRISNLIVDFRRAEQEGSMLPQIEHFKHRKQLKPPRSQMSGDVDEPAATQVIKQASAGMLAHSGFEGANEAALDLFTRMVTENIAGMGKTFRLLLDGFSGSLSPEVSHQATKADGR